MPKVTGYYPPNSPDRNKLYLDVSKELRYREKGYNDALKYYLGNHTVENVGDIIINLVKVTADRTIQFLFPRVPSFELDTTEFGNTPAEDYLANTFEANGGLAFLVKLSTLGFLTGHNFVRVDSPKDSKYITYPRFVMVDPLTVTVYWNETNIREVVWYEVKYTSDGEDYIEDIVYIQEDLWYIVTWTGAGQYIGTEEHRSPLPPIIEWAHYPSLDTYYGVSEFGQKNLQDKINRIANTLYKISLGHAEPKDLLIGANVEEIDEYKAGNLYVIDTTNPNAKIERLEIKGDMAGISDVLDRLIEVYLNVVRVILLKGEPTDLQRVTNAAVRTLFLDALAKREILIATYNEGIKDMAKLILLMGYKQGVLNSNMFDSEIRVDFHAPLPIDLSEVVNQNALALGGGYLSKASASSRMGLDWKLEQQLIRQENSELALTEVTKTARIELGTVEETGE